MSRSSLLPALLGAFLVLSCAENSPAPDAIPPDPITDLQVQQSLSGLLLRWTAPGDDGRKGNVAGYDIRYSSGNLAETWDSAAGFPYTSRPVGPGVAEAIALDPLGPGRWEFGVRAADEVPNWSDLSNIAVLVIVAPDTVAPAAVTDLAVEAVTRSSVTLSWTAPGDDGSEGRATAYEVRYATGAITQETWAQGTPAGGIPIPGAPGSRETLTIRSLQPESHYWFALRAVDEAGNRSSVSNTADAVLVGAYQLTFSAPGNHALLSDWSPDGSRIAFTRQVANTPEWSRSEIHGVNVEGGVVTQYTSLPPTGAASAKWSADGRRFFLVKFFDLHPYTVGQLAVMDAQPGAAVTVLATFGLESVGSISASRDGLRLAYTRKAPPVGGSPFSPQDLYVDSVNGDDPRLILEDVSAWGLDWDPDGTRLVCSLKEDGVYNLWILPLNGEEPRQLTFGEFDKAPPAWSPDGTEIAYASEGGLWAISPAGGVARRLTTDSTGDYPWGNPIVWAPDGKRIAYSKSTNGVYDIWISPVD